MAGFLAAVTQTPITSFIIVMEMIDGHQMVFSLMTVAMISSIVARIFSPPLYSTLADAQLARLNTTSA
jgi:H+/Cl- antiporter ClcA